MAKLFVTSDIHSYCDALMSALSDAGFDTNDENHWLVVCGDCFDRGLQSSKTLQFLTSLPRKIIVRGNHEQLLIDCCERGWAKGHDETNGTMNTIVCLGDGGNFSEMCSSTLTKVKPFIDSMVNYFETKNYIFVHSWIPLIEKNKLPVHYLYGRGYEFNPNWREADQEAWNRAAWGNPFDMVDRGLLPDKTIVFGHWHCSTGWARSEGRSEFGSDAKFDPYFGDHYISIDACTAYTQRCNVVVIEDDFLEET